MGSCPYCFGAGEVIAAGYPDRGNLVRVTCSVCHGSKEFTTWVDPELTNGEVEALLHLIAGTQTPADLRQLEGASGRLMTAYRRAYARLSTPRRRLAR